MNDQTKPCPLVVPILLGIVLNFVVGLVFLELQAPIYLDAIGTVTFTLLCGWRVGAAIGVLSVLIGGLLSPHLPYFFFTQFTIAVVVGISAKHGGFKNAFRAMLTGLALGFIAALVSAPAVALAFGAPGAFWSAIGDFLRKVFFTSEVWTEPLDKALQCLAALAIVRALPQALRARLSKPANLLEANNLG
jgi:energy-coupling factor transport system substrate-specific component